MTRRYDQGLDRVRERGEALTSVPVQDLILLELMGETGTFLEALTDDEVAEHAVIEQARSEMAVPGIEADIHSNAVESQFGDDETAIRELAQNAKDAYPAGAEQRDVRISHETYDGGSRLGVRDFGGGMLQEEVVEYLLVPFKSKKRGQSETIGEHGIGWQSVMDLASGVEVITGRQGYVTAARLREDDDRWTAELSAQEAAFDGTLVELDTDGLDQDSVEQALQKHVGFVDPSSATITFNGDQVNTLRTLYEPRGQADIYNRGEQGTVTVYATADGAAEINEVPVTQDGLYVTSQEQMTGTGSLLADILEDIMRDGYDFRVELPTNVGLTKGRNDIVARDRQEAEEAIVTAFEETVLSYLDDPAYREERDGQVAGWMEELLEEQESDRSRSSPSLPALSDMFSGGKGGGSPDSRGRGSPSFSLSASGGGRPGLVDPVIGMLLAPVTAGAIAYDIWKNGLPEDGIDHDISPEDDTGMGAGTGDLSVRMAGEEFIDAIRYRQDGVEVGEVSVNDMRAAHRRGQLSTYADLYDTVIEEIEVLGSGERLSPYDLESFVEEYAAEFETVEEGLYVNDRSKAARTVYQKLEADDGYDMSGAVKTAGTALMNLSLQQLATVTAAMRSAVDPRTYVAALRREDDQPRLWDEPDAAIPLDRLDDADPETVHRFVTEEGLDPAYFAVLETADRIDQYMSEAAGLDRHELKFVHDSERRSGYIDNGTIAFDVHNHRVRELPRQVGSQQQLDDEVYGTLVQTVARAKAREHVDEPRRTSTVACELERSFFRYCVETGMDPKLDANRWLEEKYDE
ncbi:MAG: ATP-binding protein [Candidatus Nanohaloarchaea archaeon]|nr:ATP-binding protein [Candidatus Nanohaloarchaea archaeon]